MDPNAQSTIEAFVSSMEHATRIIHEQNPTCILAPMFGAVPFIDVMNIIDDEFPNEKVVYVPASSKVYRMKEVLRGAFEKVIEEHTPNGGSILSLDEVVSGNSLTRLFKQFEAARINYANSKTVATYGKQTDFRESSVRAYRDDVINSIVYHSIGIVDKKLERQGKQRNPEYKTLVSKGVVIEVLTLCIVTMDRPEFCPAQYKLVKDDMGRDVFLPVVEGFDVSPQYIDFLGKVAGICGKDPASVTVRNLGKIRESYKIVPAHLCHL